LRASRPSREPRSEEGWIRASPRGAAQQAIHRDRRTFEAFAVDLALTDLTRENGATEIWPGSHWIVDTDEASFRATASRAAEHVSIRLTMPAGSVAIRDLRLWHRAMSNQTSEDRVILSITAQGHAA
jgi:ectoine hydroxylase-related dioxygenase (phytanoyl-CoA dioxygenase family)